MNWNEYGLLAYGTIYLAALLIAIWQRKTFPLGIVLPILFILGVGFTGLVYLIVPQSPVPSLPTNNKLSEIIFVIAYLVFVALILARRNRLSTEKNHFFKRKLNDIAFKLTFFVFIPLMSLLTFWDIGWNELGFSQGDLISQLKSATILILLLGGFNLVAGGAAAPIRARQFNTQQLILGFGLAFIWNIIETGLVEEFFFRAFLQLRLVKYLGSPISGICIASLLFGLAHAPGIYLRKGNKHGPLGEQPALTSAILL